MKVCFLTFLALAAGLAIVPATLHAQSEKLWGLWALHGPVPGVAANYNLVVTSRDKLKLGRRTSLVQSGRTTYHFPANEILLNISGNAVAGTILWSLYVTGCNLGPRTFPIRGRIGSDMKTMVLTYETPIPWYPSCKWRPGTRELVLRFTKQ